jgi:hypothetical protein
LFRIRRAPTFFAEPGAEDVGPAHVLPAQPADPSGDKAGQDPRRPDMVTVLITGEVEDVQHLRLNTDPKVLTNLQRTKG